MYIDNIRKTIKAMTDEQYVDFINKLRKNLKYKFNIEIKLSQLKIQVENFVENKIEKISMRYLDAYLLTFDDLAVQGGVKAILHGEMTVARTWRDLLMISTKDQPLPKAIKVDLIDDVLIKDIKFLFMNVLKYCANENKDILQHNIHAVNDFLSIRKDLDE